MQKNQNGKLEVFKVVGGTPTSILSQTISTNGNYSYTVTPGENLMRVVFSGTGAGNFYVDNIVIDEFTYTELYSTDFETTTIVQPDVDGWLCDLSTAYLTADAPIGQEERLIVMGTSTSGAYQYFAAAPGNDFTLSYNLAFLGAVGTMQVEIYEQNPGGPLTYLTNGSVSSNGAHTLSFTPTMSEIYVHFASNNTFALNEIVLSYEYEQMFVNYAGQSGDYRYGFQGQEKDDEIKGEENSVNYKYRMHDPRVGRFFAVDPLTHSYSELTPYQFSSNSPIFMVELEGLEGKISVTTKWYTDDGVEKSKTKVYTVDGLKADLIKICWKGYGDPSGPVVKIDYYGRMEDGSRTRHAMKGINPDAKPTVKKLNAFFSTPENSYIVKETEKKLEKERAIAKENDSHWYDGTIFHPEWGTGGDDAANTGMNAAGEQAPWPVKVIAGLNPLVSITNGISILTTDTDIYGVDASTKTDKVLAVLGIFGGLGGFTKVATAANASDEVISVTKTVDQVNTGVQSVNDAGALDKIK